jgi:hypothetical protein
VSVDKLEFKNLLVSAKGSLGALSSLAKQDRSVV